MGKSKVASCGLSWRRRSKIERSSTVNNEFLSLRDNKRPKTQQELDALMANEPDVLPAYGGAGSMATHLKRANKQYVPRDARARLTAAERAQFAAENAEPETLSP